MDYSIWGSTLGSPHLRELPNVGDGFLHAEAISP